MHRFLLASKIQRISRIFCIPFDSFLGKTQRPASLTSKIFARTNGHFCRKIDIFMSNAFRKKTHACLFSTHSIYSTSTHVGSKTFYRPNVYLTCSIIFVPHTRAIIDTNQFVYLYRIHCVTAINH